MPKIEIPELQAIVDHFEGLVTACEEYVEWLEQQRPEAWRDQTGDGVYVNGRFQAARPAGPMPEFGTPEFHDFGLNRQLTRSIGQTRGLLELLDGEGYERFRSVIDGLGTLRSAFKGEWF